MSLKSKYYLDIYTELSKMVDAGEVSQEYADSVSKCALEDIRRVREQNLSPKDEERQLNAIVQKYTCKDNAPAGKDNHLWRIPLSIFVFLIGYFLFPILFGLAFELVNFITPNFYKSSFMWRFIVSDVLGVSTAFSVMNTILKDRRYVFQTVFSVLVAVYSISVAVWNWAHAWSSLEQLLGMLAIGVTAIVFAVLNGRKIASKN